MAVGVHAIEVELNRRHSLGGTLVLYTGFTRACGAEMPTAGFTLEEKSGSRYALPKAENIVGGQAHCGWNAFLSAGLLKVFGAGASEKTIGLQPAANADIHTGMENAPIELLASE